MFNFGFLGRILGSGGGATHPPVVTVPKVLSSIIPANGDGIQIAFNQNMVMTQHLQLAMKIIVNGGAPINPDHVLINTHDPKKVALVFPKNFFKSTDVVTWAYNDQHPTEELKGAGAGGLEIDNQTYGVTNHSSSNPITRAFRSAFNKGFS